MRGQAVHGCATEQVHDCQSEQVPIGASARWHNGKTEHGQMRTIALSCNKGGVGKTSISKHIATAAAASGLNVMLLDMDTQQNATNWGRRRSQREGGGPVLPVVRFV